jgi:Flp pilus assembly protein TadD
VRVPVRFFLLLGLLMLGACAGGAPLSAGPAPGAAPAASAAGSAQPPAAPPVRAAPPSQPMRMGAAASALLAQTRAQEGRGDYVAAGVTLERAMRIEPDNPLLWVELGRLQLLQGNPAQADAMGRKALQLAGGDGEAQSSAWHLIADSLRARDRNGEAADAERRAAAVAPR